MFRQDQVPKWILGAGCVVLGSGQYLLGEVTGCDEDELKISEARS
jgi:hypothetical protein